MTRERDDEQTKPRAVRRREVAQDFPAAHSMDSGWFAFDRDGRLAHFDTDEPGAIPTGAAADAFLLTGEAGARDGGKDPFQTTILPWLARQFSEVRTYAPYPRSFYALFESAETAAALASSDAFVCEDNACLVEAWGMDWRRVAERPGFIGLVPGAPHFKQEEGTESGVQNPLLPIAYYSYAWKGSFDTYMRTAFDTHARPEVLQTGTMDVSFADAETIRLRDVFDAENLTSWNGRLDWNAPESD
ncbi:MAG: hypothetical protein AAF645_04455 [Myxococcota bacterium]